MKVSELVDFLKTLPQDMTVVYEIQDDCYVHYDTPGGESEIIDGVISDKYMWYDNWHHFNEWTREETKDKIEKVICIK